jgi:O-antigen ligase
MQSCNMASHQIHPAYHGQHNLRRRAAAPSAPMKRYFGPVLAVLFIVEGFAVKSFIFAGNDPVLVHYLASSAICALAVIYLFMIVGLKNVSFPELLLIVTAFGWSMLSSLVGTLSENVFASATFALSLFTCYVAMPRLFPGSATTLENTIRVMLVIFTIGSALLWGLFPSLAYDSASGRFSGAAISVAVACNMFFFATAVFAFAAREVESRKLFLFYLALTLLAAGMLYLTYTRSLMLQAIVCVLIVVFTGKDGRIKISSVLIAVWFLVAVVIAGLVYQIFIGVDVDQILLNLRLADGASVTSSRTLNWDFGIQRIWEAPWFGEGMLTKQTAGGTGGIDIESGGSYAVLYDPHSLILSFGVQAGIPFAVAMMSFLVLVFARHVLKMGVAASLASAPFVIGLVNLMNMVFAGGDLTSMGSSVDRLYLMFVGIVGYEAMLLSKPRRVQPPFQKSQFRPANRMRF